MRPLFRVIVTAAAVMALPAVGTAGPITPWGYQIRNETNQVLASASGLTISQVEFTDLLRIDVPAAPFNTPPQHWLDLYGPGAPYESPSMVYIDQEEVTRTLILNDEARNLTKWYTLTRMANRLWQLDPETGEWPLIGDDYYIFGNNRTWYAHIDGEDNSQQYTVIGTEDDLTVSVYSGGVPPPVPEPTTLALAGIGLAGTGLLGVRRRLFGGWL